MPRVNFKSIMSKIVLMILFISILEASMFIFMSENLAEHTINDIVHENSRKNAELYSEFLGEFFENRKHEIEIYAGMPAVKTMDWNKMAPYLKDEMHKYLDIYDNFTVADTEGNFRNTVNDKTGNIKDRKHFKDVMAGDTVVSNPIVSRTTGNKVSIIAAPIRNEYGEVIGMISGSINLIKLSKIIANLKYNYPDSYSYIIDKSGLVIAHPKEEYIMRENISIESKEINTNISKLAGQILESSEGSVTYTFNGVESLNYFHEIPGTDGWKLVIKIPLTYLHNPMRYARIRLLLIGALGFAIAVVLGHVIARSISRPIVRLKEVFMRAAEGDLTVRSDIESSDEIGKAAVSFNKMMDTLSHLTFYDPLTDLPNRILFYSRLKWELIKADGEYAKVALIIFDIDKFENINNTLGHEAGDALLKCMASRISEYLKENALISRIGEDKFAIMLTNINEERDASRIAKEILELIKQPWFVDKYRFYVTAGIGIAFYPKDGKDSQSLFRNAYSAMQRAKRTSRDTYQLYDQSMNARLIEQLDLDSNMHNALEKGEFVIHYQPQVNAATGEIMGCEALLRWNNPELGLVPPDKFIPVAEANGLIIPIGEWVLRTACRQNKLWQDAGYKPIHISVNISAVQLMRENFIDVVSGILRETQLSPEYLELEITETVAAENAELISSVLDRLKHMGVRIALDDFGTGYSSLNYLTNFPISNLKIDRSFITDLDVNPRNSAIVTSILAIGNSFNIDVTAEGVETEEQYSILKNQNCSFIQGYFFSRPLPGEEFEKLLG